MHFLGDRLPLCPTSWFTSDCRQWIFLLNQPPMIEPNLSKDSQKWVKPKEKHLLFASMPWPAANFERQFPHIVGQLSAAQVAKFHQRTDVMLCDHRKSYRNLSSLDLAQGLFSQFQGDGWLQLEMITLGRRKLNIPTGNVWFENLKAQIWKMADPSSWG